MALTNNLGVSLGTQKLALYSSDLKKVAETTDDVIQAENLIKEIITVATNVAIQLGKIQGKV